MDNKTESPKQSSQKGLIEEFIGDVINFERGLLGIFVEFLKSPTKVIDGYFIDRTQQVSPFKYAIFILTIVTLVNTLFIDYDSLMQKSAESGYTIGRGEEESAEAFDRSIQDLSEELEVDISGFIDALNDISVGISTKYSYVFYILILVPCFAFCSKVFFGKKKSSFKEHYVMTLYSFSTVSVINLLFLPLMLDIENMWFYTLLTSISMFVMSVYTQISYLKLKGFDEYMQSFLSFILGLIIYMLVTAVLMLFASIILFIVRS